jgi:hypothetical protein
VVEFVNVGKRKDPKNGHERLSIRVQEKGGNSIDVLTEDGKFFCRVNLFVLANREDGTWGDIDVIVQDHQQGTFLAWLEGKEVVRERPEGVTVFAVDIRDKK